MRALPLLLILGACAPPDTSELFTDVQITPEATAADTHQHFLTLFDNAEHELQVALPRIEDELLSDAIIEAHDRGVEVRVVTDIDRADDAGVLALQEAGVPLALADAEITYFDFNLKEDVLWESEQTLMSHAFAIADQTVGVSATSAGGLEDGTRIVLDLRGEDVVEDLYIEHNQIFGGSDAVATTAYDSQAKSIADYRWVYQSTQEQPLELWFGPQERLTKRVIDAVYRAKASVWVLTNDFANDGLAKALQDKAEYGFDVRVVVGPEFGASQFQLSQFLRTNTPDVDKAQVDDPVVPTLVLIDYEQARNGRQYTSRAMMLSHDMYSAARLWRDDEVINDQLIDGNLWVLNDPDKPSGAMLDLEAIWLDHFDRAGALQ